MELQSSKNVYLLNGKSKNEYLLYLLVCSSLTKQIFCKIYSKYLAIQLFLSPNKWVDRTAENSKTVEFCLLLPLGIGQTTSFVRSKVTEKWPSKLCERKNERLQVIFWTKPLHEIAKCYVCNRHSVITKYVQKKRVLVYTKPEIK